MPRKKNADLPKGKINPKPTGKDEMNLAELPTALAAEHVPKGTKTLIFGEKGKELIITGSDHFGLPTAVDTEVILALIQYTKEETHFDPNKPIIHFTRYKILKILKWPNESKYYDRLDHALNVWAGLTLYYNNCWYDKKTGKNGHASMHIIENLFIIAGKARDEENDEQAALPLSSFRWNDIFMESVAAGNLKSIDADMFFELKQSASKQLYRFLSKRFWQNSSWTFNLYELAFDRAGLNPSYKDNVTKIKDKLIPALIELEEWQFLEPLPPTERFFKHGDTWKIRLSRNKSLTKAIKDGIESEQIPQPQPVLSPLALELEKRGVTPSVIIELVERFSAEFIEEKIEEFDWKLKQPKPPKSPAGWLVGSIRGKYKTNPLFISKTEQLRRTEAAKQAREKELADYRQRMANAAAERAEDLAIKSYWESLTPENQAACQAAADATAEPATSGNDPELNESLNRWGQNVRRIEHIRQLLRNRQMEDA